MTQEDSKSTASDQDPLAAIITLLRPQAVLSKIVSGAGDWCVRKPPYQDPAFCLMLTGSCFLDLDNIGSVELKEGDFILLPAMPGFTLASDLNLTATPVDLDPAPKTHYGTGPTTMSMLGGYFHFDRANAPLLLKLLPPVIHISNEQPGAVRVRRIVELIGEETGTERPCSALVLERLVEVLLIEALRFRTTSAPREEQGLLAGISDFALAKALREIHTDLARRWTIEQLARVAGMSRSVFADRFTRKVGMPPMRYLLEWRMAVAKDLLLTERPSLADVAERVGYQSASAFSTAFTREVGCSPSDFARSGVKSL